MRSLIVAVVGSLLLALGASELNAQVYPTFEVRGTDLIITGTDDIEVVEISINGWGALVVTVSNLGWESRPDNYSLTRVYAEELGTNITRIVCHLEGGDDSFYNLTSIDDTVTTTDGQNAIFCGHGFSAFFGGKGRDVVRGGKGDDWLNGGEGADWIDGGEGRDTVCDNVVFFSVLHDSDYDVFIDDGLDALFPGPGDRVDRW